MSSTELRPLDRDIAATLALAAYSTVVGFGLARVFGSWDFAGDMISIVIVGHGASLALCRWRLSGWVAVPAVVLLLVWLIALQSYRSTFNAVFPTGATWDLFRLETDLVREQFRTAVGARALRRRLGDVVGFGDHVGRRPIRHLRVSGRGSRRGVGSRRGAVHLHRRARHRTGMPPWAPIAAG